MKEWHFRLSLQRIISECELSTNFYIPNMGEQKISLSTWLAASRLRTLPLALSVVFVGQALALKNQKFDGLIFSLALLTTILLQVLSNLANDYGDFKNGADNHNRIGPSRAVQSGLISPSAMRKAVIFLSIAAFLSGIGLLVAARNNITQQHFFMLIGLGIVAIAAALFYTAGKKPYGYAGLGDISVFLFFGLLGVVGNFFLQVGFLRLNIFLPAFAFGALSVMVLNLNNMRDIHNDAEAGKKTIPVRLGSSKAKIYHIGLFVFAFLSLIIYSIESYRFPFVWIWPLFSLIFVPDLIKIARISEPALFDPFLKKTAIKTFLLSLIIFAHCIFLNG